MKKSVESTQSTERKQELLTTPTDLKAAATRSAMMNGILAELCDDNKALATRLREAHNVCEEERDIATASLIEVWIDETERRTWYLFEASWPGDPGRTLIRQVNSVRQRNRQQEISHV